MVLNSTVQKFTVWHVHIYQIW